MEIKIDNCICSCNCYLNCNFNCKFLQNQDDEQLSERLSKIISFYSRLKKSCWGNIIVSYFSKNDHFKRQINNAFTLLIN